MRITRGNQDYKIDKIPAGVMGQAYVLLSRSCTDFSDEKVIAGPSVIEVSVSIVVQFVSSLRVCVRSILRARRLPCRTPSVRKEHGKGGWDGDGISSLGVIGENCQIMMEDRVYGTI